MKQTCSIVLCALICFTSAKKLEPWVYEGSKSDHNGIPAYNSDTLAGPYSNQIANGDRDDDKQLEKERDTEDDIVQDNGFGM